MMYIPLLQRICVVMTMNRHAQMVKKYAVNSSSSQMENALNAQRYVKMDIVMKTLASVTYITQVLNAAHINAIYNRSNAMVQVVVYWITNVNAVIQTMFLMVKHAQI